MTVGSAPIFRFTLQNPAKPTGRVEFIWEPAYDYDNKVPTNGWRTETVSFSQVRAQLSEVLPCMLEWNVARTALPAAWTNE